VELNLFRRGHWGTLLPFVRLTDGPLEVLDDLKRKSSSDYKQLLARFQRLADKGPQHHDWFKTLEDTGGLRQLSYRQHRYLLMLHPADPRCFILLHYFRKQRRRTPPHELKRGMDLAIRCQALLTGEEPT